MSGWSRPARIATLAGVAILLISAIGASGAVSPSRRSRGATAARAKRPKLNPKRLKLTLVAKGLTLPCYVTAPPGDTSRLLVVQQNGLVSLIKDGVLQKTPFLDLRDRVHASGEKGMLSIVFSPDYAQSRLLYAYYNDLDGNIRLVQFRGTAADPDVIDPSTGRQLFEIVKPAADHNGGMMQFGPDGDLYISVGDGGANPPKVPVGEYGQTLDDLLGNILRIDPSHGDPYSIPLGNPFVDTPGARPEIIAYGLRNPWRFWIDDKTNTMLIGDVGEGTREEIDRLPLDKLGLNFGWPCMEGTTTPPPTIERPASCATAVLTPPIYQYAHTPSRCAIIGGVVARDPRLPQLNGLYLWTDFCASQLLAIDPAKAKPTGIALHLPVKEPTSFGVDALDRIYVTTLGGQVYRIDPAV